GAVAGAVDQPDGRHANGRRSTAARGISRARYPGDGTSEAIAQRVPAPYFIVTFCTLKFPTSPTYSVLSLRQSIALTVPNSFGSLPALPNLPIIVPSRR